jgi:hypothetical protein
LLARQLVVVLPTGRCIQGGTVTKVVVFAGVAVASLLVAAHCQGRLLSPWEYLKSFWLQVRA